MTSSVIAPGRGKYLSAERLLLTSAVDDSGVGASLQAVEKLSIHAYLCTKRQEEPKEPRARLLNMCVVFPTICQSASLPYDTLQHFLLKLDDAPQSVGSLHELLALAVLCCRPLRWASTLYLRR
jgi:hypothetical protein